MDSHTLVKEIKRLLLNKKKEFISFVRDLHDTIICGTSCSYHK